MYEYILGQYKAAHPGQRGAAIEPAAVAEWACKRGIYNKPPLTMAERLAHELSRWLRAEQFRDPQGRDVRANHAIIVEVMTPKGPKKISRWYPLFDAPPEHITTSFQLRRRSLSGDARQLHLDWESYNDNNKFRAKLKPINYDLNEDIKEMALPTEYPTEAPDDFDEDDEI
jgi:hypothetical protein